MWCDSSLIACFVILLFRKVVYRLQYANSGGIFNNRLAANLLEKELGLLSERISKIG